MSESNRFLEGLNVGTEIIKIDNIRDVADIIAYSFQFSQGDRNLQFLILNEIGHMVELSDDIKDDEVKQTLSDALTDQAGQLRLVGKDAHPYVDPREVIEEFEQVHIFMSKLRNPIDYKADHLHHIMREIWGRDSIKMSNYGREDRLDEHVGTNDLRDRYLSLGVKYLIKKESTGNSIFDRLIAKLTNSKDFSPAEVENIKQVVAKYNEHHPETPVSDEEINAYLLAP